MKTFTSFKFGPLLAIFAFVLGSFGILVCLTDLFFANAGFFGFKDLITCALLFLLGFVALKL